jgi:hypothetical protein
MVSWSVRSAVLDTMLMREDEKSDNEEERYCRNSHDDSCILLYAEHNNYSIHT